MHQNADGVFELEKSLKMSCARRLEIARKHQFREYSEPAKRVNKVVYSYIVENLRGCTLMVISMHAHSWMTILGTPMLYFLPR